MTPSSLSAIDSVLSQLRSVADVAANQTRSVNAGPVGSPPSFAVELQRSLNKLAATQNHANTQAEAFVAGAPGISLNDVMIDSQKASLAFQTTLQMRNRLVEAYKTVSSMPV
ncbi:flagellar hook-basal body complex protein FliE [Paenalcaligenes hominis]|uniref:flagellar hook-basal body complex protein FliE n=1 Tax=Paenalcaligenes hominis TaxID=643674 RepID=UPI00352575DB